MALSILEQDNSIDLLVLDYNMPKLNGYEVIQVLKTKNRKIPIILLTGSSEADFDDSDIHALLRKPVDLSILEESVNRLLGIRDS